MNVKLELCANLFCVFSTRIAPHNTRRSAYSDPSSCAGVEPQRRDARSCVCKSPRTSLLCYRNHGTNAVLTLHPQGMMPL